MTKLKELEQHIVNRLVLAKSIHKKAVELFNSSNDTFAFSHGLIALHDALDNFVGAIASILNAKSKGQSFLMETIHSIEEHERNSSNGKNFVFVKKSEIAQLNTMRKNIKHQGILPNVQQAKGLVAPITIVFREYTRKYFDLNWEVVSLSDLIKEEKTRNDVVDVERLIDSGKYKDALNNMALIKFQVLEEDKAKNRSSLGSLIPLPVREPQETILHGQVDIHERAELLEKGIDRSLMQKFEKLTARVELNDDEGQEYIYWHSRSEWGPLNWTKENALFCYEFLVDAIIKNQGQPSSLTVRPHWAVYTIKAIKDLNFCNQAGDVLFTLKKNEMRRAFISERIDNSWELDSISRQMGIYIILMQEVNLEQVNGFINENEKDDFEIVKTEIYTQDSNGEMTLLDRMVRD